MKHIHELLFAGVQHRFERQREGGHGFGGHGFGGRGFGGRPGGLGGRWGGRTRRGEGKYLILDVLTAGPQHGYEIMSAIEAKHGFRPSPGSIYPTLQMLDDGGFVTSTEAEGKRTFTITDSGRDLLAGHARDDAGDADGDDARHRAKAAAIKLMAAMASARTSDDATLDKIREVIDRARRDIYAILASDES